MQKSRSPIRTALSYLPVIISVFAALVVMMSFTGNWPTNTNPYKSYSLQACAWLEGRLDLGVDYPWLELAIYQDRYYVSFPPFPSYVLLPFCMIFGSETPDHWINLFFTLLSVVEALQLCGQFGAQRRDHGFWVLFLFLGTGYVHIALQGWVWHLAQCMCIALSLAALNHACRGHGTASLTLWACAVGCRPMVAVYFPILAYLLWRRNTAVKDFSLPELIRRRWYWAIGPLMVAASYMILNYCRFGSILEFGHTYLPEFVRAENGQFSLTYLPSNFSQLFRLPQPGGENGALTYYTFECQAFYLIAPIFLSIAAAWFFALLRKRREQRFMLICLPLLALIHLFILLCHRTMGGWQWGNRYLLDMLPYLFLGLLVWMPKGERFTRWNMPLFILGTVINVIGSVATYNHWI